MTLGLLVWLALQKISSGLSRKGQDDELRHPGAGTPNLSLRGTNIDSLPADNRGEGTINTSEMADRFPIHVYLGDAERVGWSC
jgi:hypothetical protein